MKPAPLVMAILLGFSLKALAQPEVAWERNYGGGNGQYGEALVVVPNNGGYAIGGRSGGGTLHFWLCRIDRDGNETWTQEYDIEGTSNECYDLCMTNDNGSLLVGKKYENNAYGWHVIRTDAQGDVVWRRSYYEGGVATNWANAVVAVQSDQYVIVGGRCEQNQNPDGMALKIDGNGDPIWERRVGDDNSQMFNDIVVAENGYAICGNTNEGNSMDAWLVKVSDNGEVVWQRRFGVDDAEERLFGLVRIGDDGFGVTGWRANRDRSLYSYYIAQTNADGEVNWSHDYHFDPLAVGNAIVQQADGGFTVAGQHKVDERYYSPHAINVDRDGNQAWTMAAGHAFFYSEFKDVVRDPVNHATLMCGSTYINNQLMDALLVKLADVNHPPEIIERIPDDSIIFLLTGEDSVLSVHAIDIDGDQLTYRWTVDGDTVEDTEALVFAARQEGTHQIRCYVRDWQFTVSTDWEVRVYDLLRGYEPADLNLSLALDTTINFIVHPGVPLDSLAIIWHKDGQVIGQDTLVQITFPDTGRFVVRSDVQWLGRADSVIWNVLVAQPPEPPDTQAVKTEVLLPDRPDLLTIYPNPFNERCTVGFTLPGATDVRVSLLSLDGRPVAKLYEGRASAGRHAVDFDGHKVISGIYFVSFESGGSRQVKKALLVK